MLLGQLLCAIAFTVIWARGAFGRGIGAAVIFGLLIALLQNVWVLANYVVLPMPGVIAVKWFISGVFQAVIVAIAIATVYKRDPSSARGT